MREAEINFYNLEIDVRVHGNIFDPEVKKLTTILDYYQLTYFFMSNQVYTHFLRWFMRNSDGIKIEDNKVSFPIMRIQKTFSNPEYFYGFQEIKNFLQSKDLIGNELFWI